MGPVWAKIDMVGLLPVERILYLDADTLVRRNFRPLWEADLQGKPLGAVVDVGHPMGWDKDHKQPYFNAGVLLLDLAKARERLPELKALSLGHENAKYRDQDALNAHFTGNNWVPLGLEWNAQGLGTYARYPSPERDILPLEAMEDPSIVHFTGPVNPSIVEVLNPYVQPPTAKPWGYLGAPGHPYATEWQAAFEKTPWKSKKEDLVCLHEEARRKAVDDMKSEFDIAANRLAGPLI
jgi:lipopolysaccharide biosynthesis glycosyltransferase